MRNHPKKGGKKIHSWSSEKYTWDKSRGTSSIQTWKEEKLQAIQDKPWAILFPSLRVWLKETLLNAEERCLMSLIIWPKLEEEKPPEFMALMITSASPSKITCPKFRSLAKHTALRAANTSTVSTEVGRGIGCEKAAITRPLSLRIIAPKPARFLEGKVAPSKLTLSQPGGGGDHFAELTEGEGRRGREEARWNSWRLSTAKVLIRSMGTEASPTLIIRLIYKKVNLNPCTKTN